MKIEDVLEHLLATQRVNNGWISFSVEECELLLDYITTLQRKEYNNSKAIEYIKDTCWYPELENYSNMTDDEVIELLNILEKKENRI